MHVAKLTAKKVICKTSSNLSTHNLIQQMYPQTYVCVKIIMYYLLTKDFVLVSVHYY